MLDFINFVWAIVILKNGNSPCRSDQERDRSGADFVSCLELSEAVESARALLDTWTPEALEEARGLFYMVNGWLPDEDDLGAGEMSGWFRTKLERLVEAGERCFQIEGGKGVRFVPWVGGKAVQCCEEGAVEEDGAEEGAQGRILRETADLVELNGKEKEVTERLVGARIEPSPERKETADDEQLGTNKENSRSTDGVSQREETQRQERSEMGSHKTSSDDRTEVGGHVESDVGGCGEDIFERAFENFVKDASEDFWTGESEVDWMETDEEKRFE